jgi:hypothetical protein
MTNRVSDFALLIAHVWRCTQCRDHLMAQPEIYWIGFKLSDEQRATIRNLSDESFQTIARLAEETQLSARELDEAVDHPRARLRHLGVVKYDYRGRDER